MNSSKKFLVVFYKPPGSNKELVRQWLKTLDKQAKKGIGRDIMTLQYRWPLGMPLIRKMEPDLWELRSLVANRIARIFFTTHKNSIILLHGFIKKSKKTPPKELAIGRQRLRIAKEFFND